VDNLYFVTIGSFFVNLTFFDDKNQIKFVREPKQYTRDEVNIILDLLDVHFSDGYDVSIKSYPV
jgi:hypothetical protein